MSRKEQPKPDDPAQYKRFLEAAREAETSEDPKVFDEAFRKVAPVSRAAEKKGRREQSE